MAKTYARDPAVPAKGSVIAIQSAYPVQLSKLEVIPSEFTTRTPTRLSEQLRA